MSSISLQTIQSIYTDLLQGNISKMLSLIDLHVVIHNPDSLPYGGIHEGREGFIALMTNVYATWSSFQIIPNNFISTGDYIVVQGEMIGQAATRNQIFKTPFVHVWKMPDASITEIWLYEWDTAQLLDYLKKEE